MLKTVVISILFFLILPLVSFSQDFDEKGFLVIKAEPDLPLALVSITRSRPLFKPMVIKKDISNISVFFEVSVISPPKRELQPKKIKDLKLLLAKERF